MKAISRSTEYYDTLRDELAGKAMQSILRELESDTSCDQVAKMSYLMADSMLKRRIYES